MADTSAVGLYCWLVASVTFPVGTSITAFPEDNDVGENGETEIGGHASGINGHLITWSTANGIEVQIPVIPETEDEAKLTLLYDANRVRPNGIPKKDIITLTVTDPVTGIPKVYKKGKIINGKSGQQYGGSGRIATKVFTFVFEDVV